MAVLLDRVKEIAKEKYGGIKKCVLAYSGGLDTSIIAYIFQDIGIEVITLTLEFGQNEDLRAIEEGAKRINVKKHYGIEATEEYVRDYVYPAIKANCLYEGVYPEVSALGRPLIAKYLVEVAKKEGAQAIAHGSTGKGNDQIRIDNGIRALNGDLVIIAPIRDWELFRDEEIEYAIEKKLPITATKKKPYSVDQNIWGRSIECGVLEHPEVEPPEDAFEWTVSPAKAPDHPTYVDIEFEKGVPVEMKVMDEKKKVKEVARGVKLIERLNKIAGENGVGRCDHVEDRIIGLKNREVYEYPAASVLLRAHRDLETFVLSKRELDAKNYIDRMWGELVYGGGWFSPLREELDAFIDKSQEVVSGRVMMKLYKGSAVPVGRESKNALYDLKKATYDKGTTWSQREGGVYSKLFGAQANAAYHIRHGGK